MNILATQIEAHLLVISPEIKKMDVFNIPEQTTEFELSKIPHQKLFDLYRALVGYEFYAITETHLFLFN